jgi:hypothetical protein
MGQGLMRRPPQYCNGFLDRHGRARWYFRRAGFKKVPLPGLPWSPEFMAAYEQALAGSQRRSARNAPFQAPFAPWPCPISPVRHFGRRGQVRSTPTAT